MESVDLAMLHKETTKSSVPDVASMSVGTLEVSFLRVTFLIILTAVPWFATTGERNCGKEACWHKRKTV